MIYGWEGNILAFESNDQVTKHYVYEKGSFVPLVQAVYTEAIELHQTPDWSDKPYSLQRDPLWKTGKKAKDLNDVWFYHCDHLGTPQEMTDHTGMVIWKANYLAWRECKAEKVKSNFFENSEIISNNIRFQGQYFDLETGLHYNRYRYYSPDVGRFISKDPIGLLGGHNVYVYVYAYAPNPVGWIDPLGLMKCGLTGEEIGDATNLPIIKPNTPQWKQAVDSIKNEGKNKPNFRVQDKETADKMLKDSKKNIPEYDTYTENKYKVSYEYHPN